jgi:hypothetical protein
MQLPVSMVSPENYRHCEEQSDEAIHSFLARSDGLLRFARNDVDGSEPTLQEKSRML